MANLALSLRNLTRKLLTEYDQREGMSADQYCSNAQWHPMAEGKYLSALAESRKLKIIGGSQCNLMRKRAYARLRAGNLASKESQACWGLGFSYKNTGPREPFLITTAIVTRGLLDQERAVDNDLLKQSLAWLDAYAWMMSARFGARRIRLPAFSPNVPLVVINAVSYWAGVMSAARQHISVAGRRAADRAARWVLQRYTAPVGWPYTRESARFDLLHQCYILEGLSMWSHAMQHDARHIEKLALETVSGFQIGWQWIDKADVVNRDAAIEACGKSSHYSMAALGGDRWFLRHHVEARPWSYGELLVVMSRFAESGQHADHWRTLARRAGVVLAQRLEHGSAASQVKSYTEHARDLMHIAHGLVRLLAVLRGQPAERNQLELDSDSAQSRQ